MTPRLLSTLQACRTHALGLGLAATVLALSACSILPKSDPVAVYRLPGASANTNTVATNAAPATKPGGLRALRIGTPYASHAIDSEQILVLPEGDLIKSYAGARWSDPAPILLRNRLLDALHSDGRFDQLSDDSSNISAELELSGNLSAFQAEYRHGVPTIVIQFDARLVDSATRRQVAAQRFSLSQAASGTQVGEVVNAFGAASDTLSQQIVTWLVSLPAARAR